MLAEETDDWTLNWRQAGRREGEISLLKRQLSLRFGALPGWVERRLDEASLEQLEQWGERILDAATVEQVFDSPSRD